MEIRSVVMRSDEMKTLSGDVSKKKNVLIDSRRENESIKIERGAKRIRINLDP